MDTHSIDPQGPLRGWSRLLLESVADGAIVLLDVDGRAVSWNDGAERIVGYTSEGGSDRQLDPRVERTSGADADDHRLAVARTTGRFEDEGWQVLKDGTRFWADVVLTALRSSTGELIGFAKIVRTLPERRFADDDLRRTEKQFRLLVDGVKDYAIFMLDRDGHVASWNAGARSIKGYEAHEIIGRHFSTFYPPEVAADRWPEYELAAATKEGRFEHEGWRVRKDGTYFWANVVITPLRDPAGELCGFAKITRDLTARRRIEELQRNERRINEFLAMLAHEIRNPLAPMRSAVQLLQTTAVGEDQHDEVVDVLNRQLSHITRLVDELLDVARIAHGKIELHRETVDLRDTILELARSVQPLIAERGHELSLHLVADPVLIEGDRARILQCLLNLIDNAAKYTPRGGRIEIELERDVQAVIRVSDNGVGMTDDLLGRVFEPFVQGNPSLARQEGGLGIGLTLVKRLVELHGGSITAKSAGPGHGSSLVLTFPRLEARRHRPPTCPPAAVVSPLPRRILVVDDNRDSAAMMAALLAAWGHDVRSAFDGPSAIEAARAFRPDVVLLDIGLPGMNGYDVAQRLHAAPELAGVTLVAFTGYGQEEDRRRTQAAGFHHHLVKPVDARQLSAILDISRAVA